MSPQAKTPEKDTKKADVQSEQAAAQQDTGASTDERQKLAAQLLKDVKPPKADDPKPSPEAEKASAATVGKRREEDERLVAAAQERMKNNPGQGYSQAEVDAIQRLSKTPARRTRVTREKSWREGTFAPYAETVTGSVVLVQIEVEGMRDPVWFTVGRFEDEGFYDAIKEELTKLSRRKGFPKADEAVLLTQRARNCRVSRPRAAEAQAA